MKTFSKRLATSNKSNIFNKIVSTYDHIPNFSPTATKTGNLFYSKIITKYDRKFQKQSFEGWKREHLLNKTGLRKTGIVEFYVTKSRNQEYNIKYKIKNRKNGHLSQRTQRLICSITYGTKKIPGFQNEEMTLRYIHSEMNSYPSGMEQHNSSSYNDVLEIHSF